MWLFTIIPIKAICNLVENIILLNSLHYAKSSITGVFSRSFPVSGERFSMLGGPSGSVVPPGTPSIENGAHGTKKLMLKTEVSEHFL